jgi:MoaA/NifB/PqqE/SkfB family radical SAM enzyme/nitroimidazol reductase NimA-like FMN-containing flavoprotein (pyridoxamine 5'-phosphate oxidase superfamily)
MASFEAYIMNKISRAMTRILFMSTAAHPRLAQGMLYPVEKIGPRKYRAWAGIFRYAKRRNHPLFRLMKRFAEEVNPHCRHRLMETLPGFPWGNGGFPRALVISVTSKCNYACDACFNSALKHGKTMDKEALSRIIRKAKAGGTRLFALSGGEPLLMPGLLEVIKGHRDVYFQVFTNGSLITGDIAEGLAELGNTMILISLDGNEAMTDDRRGKGAHEKAFEAMHRLRSRGVVFGCNVMVTSENVQSVTSSVFVNNLVEAGAMMIWYISYRPVGDNPDFKLLLTPEEHLKLYERIREIRNSHAIVALENLYDFSGGCLATQGLATHIDPEGNLTPCPPMHFSTDNVLNGRGLKETVEGSSMLNAIRAFHEPGHSKCIILEKPEVLGDIIHKLGAVDTTGGLDTEALRRYIEYRKNQQQSMLPAPTKEADLYGELKALLFRGPQASRPKTLNTLSKEGGEGLRNLVVDFLRRNSYCTVATSDDESPHASIVLYASRDMELYFFTGSGTKKLRNILKNPRVAVAVEGRKLLVFPQAVQIQGRAEVLPKDDKEAENVYFSRLRFEHRIAKRIYDRYDVRWVKIVPEKIFTYRIGTRFWRVDPEEQFRRLVLG